MSECRLAGRCLPSDHSHSRRMFLHGAIAGGAAFGGFGRLFAADHAEVAARDQKHVILLFMSGGPSQFETWDPKPGRPTGGPHLSIPTSVAGIHFDEYMPNLARLADKMAVIRTVTSRLGDHMEGHFLAQTGHPPSNVIAPPPHWLSICAHEKPALDSNLPSYVMLGAQNGGSLAVPGAGYLGSAYQGLYCPPGGKPPQDLPVATPQEVAAFQRREALRASISGRFGQGRGVRVVESHNAAFAEVERLLNSGDLFDISKESPRDLERYGESDLGKDCLLARRLVERGVPFVRVQHQNGLAWDKHRRAFDSQRHITTEFDRAAGALIDDLQERGLWESTLVVLMGEFGRTPDIQGQGPPGRNHWTRNWAMSLGGCGIRGGVVVGQTNENGTDIKDRPVTVPDLFATFYTALGINPNKELEFEGRPIPFVENKSGKPVAEIL
jgi:hypothetical protein